MKAIYIYLFRSNYTEEHINHMIAMLACMETAGELSGSTETDRDDLNAWEVGANATPWAIEFLEHLSACDMVHMTYEPIVAD